MIVDLKYVSLLMIVDFDIEVFHAPLEGFLVRGEENINSISFDGSASVEHFDGSPLAIAGDDHLRAESVSFVGRYERVAGLYHVAARRHAVRIWPAAFRARTVGRDAHSHGLPFVDRLLIQSGVWCNCRCFWWGWRRQA